MERQQDKARQLEINALEALSVVTRASLNLAANIKIIEAYREAPEGTPERNTYDYAVRMNEEYQAEFNKACVVYFDRNQALSAIGREGI